MNDLEAIKNRRSIRKYKGKPIENEKREILEKDWKSKQVVAEAVAKPKNVNMDFYDKESAPFVVRRPLSQLEDEL